MTAPDAHGAVTAVWRVEAGRLVAALVRLVGDVGRAEELAQDALVAALEQWPRTGIPDRPGAWLMTVAKRRALNVLSRAEMAERKHDDVRRSIEAKDEPGRMEEDLQDAIDDFVGDDLLRLVFVACHPDLPPPARVALTLRLVGGLTTEEIARAFLVPEPTVAQRIVRARRTIAEKGIPFDLPGPHELGARLSSVLEVVYLIFNEGYSATRGDDVVRPALCDDALRLGRVLAELASAEHEVHGLLALMELNASRTPARTDESGEAVLLMDQDRGRWDRGHIERGLQALARADPGDGSAGPYAIQAAIAACHASAAAPEDTDWARIAALYGELSRLTTSPVVELNRAMAVAMAEGPAAGLEILDALTDEPTLREYHLLPSARADLLEKLGRASEARAEFQRAASLTRNERQRERLLARAAACGR